MKNLVKISFLVAFFAAIGFSANAQTSFSTIDVGAKVFDQITVEGFRNLNFGQVMINTTKKVDIDGDITAPAGISESGVQVGVFKVFAGAGSDVTLDFAGISTLSDGTNTMAIRFNDGTNDLVGYGLDADDASAAVRFSNFSAIVANGQTANSFPTHTIDNKNGIYVYVGAEVTAGATQASGTYTGTVTLTATYN
ncbi:DUF4402 domain-containing protein [Aquiflexum sp. LQ15W]|uniref:DUF4402 domain-containing protein n=1 Tax=Cognataquiflexum nitidum TaxID=2922272 RepID=UPI001F133BBF|nr:DUF4402 domain-containing protein [Cognataquiflexum nitidum]MCH6199889.1 DUF4402 domain-containing protein [Cognataquiflexum nitidum]